MPLSTLNKYICRILLFFLALAVLPIGTGLQAGAEENGDGNIPSAEVNSSVLKAEDSKEFLQSFKTEILMRRSQVAEFKLLKQIAENRGLRVFLMGGLASSYARYIAWDLKRRAGDSKYQEDYFHYIWEQIFYPTQDIDLVIERLDARPESDEDLDQFKNQVESFFPNIKVDVFGMRTSRPNRPAVGDRFSDLHKQNTDSVSNGLIELTSQDLILDLRFKDDRFLRDLWESKIALHIDPDHDKTERAQRKDNPALVSVIRMIINAGRYHLEIDEASLRMARSIISKFSVGELSDYCKNWILKNAKKLIEQAYNLERSFQLIYKDTGLAQILLAISNDRSQVGSLAWLLTRKPLESNPRISTGLKREQTARSLGIDIITHETRNFQTFRQMIFNPEGRLNAFQSVQGDGQNALYGEGFYAKIGEWGDSVGGFHIRLRLSPDAVLGSDFAIKKKYVLVFNRSKLHVIYPDIRDKVYFLSQIIQDISTNEGKGIPALVAAVATFSFGLESLRLSVMKEFLGLLNQKRYAEGRLLLDIFSSDQVISGLLSVAVDKPQFRDSSHFYQKRIRSLRRQISFLEQATLGGVIGFYIAPSVIFLALGQFLMPHSSPFRPIISLAILLSWALPFSKRMEHLYPRFLGYLGLRKLAQMRADKKNLLEQYLLLSSLVVRPVTGPDSSDNQRLEEHRLKDQCIAQIRAL